MRRMGLLLGCMGLVLLAGLTRFVSRSGAG